MVEVKKEGILLTKTSLGFENEGVLNPAVIQDGGRLHLFYRAVAKGNYSTIGYCELSNPVTTGKRSDIPILFPQFEYETHGLDDPRIVKIEDTFYLTYSEGYGYCSCAALLDVNNPQKEIGRLPYPLFETEYEWELKGEVNNVCFPSGALVVEDTLYIYYGAADERIACASMSMSALLKELLLNKN